MYLPVSLLGHPAPVRHLSHLPAPRRRSQATSSRPSDRAIFLISVYGLGEGEGDGEAAGDAVGEGDGEVVGNAVGGSVVAGPVEGHGNPRINRPLPSYTLPSSYPVREERF
jgi:hypothetical protein